MSSPELISEGGDVTTPTVSPAPFQIEDMEHLQDRDWSANWSEMLSAAIKRLLRVGSFLGGRKG